MFTETCSATKVTDPQLNESVGLWYVSSTGHGAWMAVERERERILRKECAPSARDKAPVGIDNDEDVRRKDVITTAHLDLGSISPG